MRIEEDLKLGFKDVLIRPKRSTLKSRSDVELERQFTFKHSGQTWSGVPIIAANMDTVGTFAMATALASFDILTAVHKHTILLKTDGQSQRFHGRAFHDLVLRLVKNGIWPCFYGIFPRLRQHHGAGRHSGRQVWRRQGAVRGCRAAGRYLFSSRRCPWAYRWC